MLARKEVDFSSSSFSVTDERSEAVDFTGYVIFDYLKLFMQKPKENFQVQMDTYFKVCFHEGSRSR